MVMRGRLAGAGSIGRPLIVGRRGPERQSVSPVLLPRLCWKDFLRKFREKMRDEPVTLTIPSSTGKTYAAARRRDHAGHDAASVRMGRLRSCCGGFFR